MKLKLIMSLLLLFLFFSPGFGYFENKFYCYIKNTSIVVSLRQDQDYQSCITLAKGIEEKIYQVDDNIAKADKFIQKKEDLDYRLNIKATMTKQKSSLEYVYAQLNQNMDNFEKGLFVKIQKLLSYYLTKQRNLVVVKIDKTKENISDSRKSGNLLLFEENIKNLDDLTLKKDILNDILNATNFEEMIPFLKYYLKYYKNKA